MNEKEPLFIAEDGYVSHFPHVHGNLNFACMGLCKRVAGPMMVAKAS
jgi:hypothetical protein